MLHELARCCLTAGVLVFTTDAGHVGEIPLRPSKRDTRAGFASNLADEHHGGETGVHLVVYNGIPGCYIA